MLNFLKNSKIILKNNPGQNLFLSRYNLTLNNNKINLIEKIKEDQKFIKIKKGKK